MKVKAILALLAACILLSTAALAGGKYDLDDFGYRYVDSRGRGSLVFQQSPRGKSMKGHKFYTGDRIYVNLHWRQDGYAIAYEDGEYGYVDASFIDWERGSEKKPGGGQHGGGRSGGGTSGGISSSAKDLSDYEYRRVKSNGRGSLVFQQSPRGKSMSGHRFYDGDWIYVNVSYRKEGYAVACEDGEYGYVDASFIDWSSRKSGGGGQSGGGTVTLTGDANIRSGPGLGYRILGSVKSGYTLSYAGETRRDDRGVSWYRVYYGGDEGWVSSKYASLRGGSGSGGGAPRSDAEELSGYFGRNVDSAVRALGGGFTRYSEDGMDGIDQSYEKNGLRLSASGSTIRQIHITRGTKYALKGITIGMRKSDVQSKMQYYAKQFSAINADEYIIRGTKSAWEILLNVEYTDGRVTAIGYGYWF